MQNMPSKTDSARLDTDIYVSETFDVFANEFKINSNKSVTINMLYFKGYLI